MTEAWLVLLGTVVGAAAGVTGQLVTAVFTHRSDRRRLAVEAGFREWEKMDAMAQAARAEGRGASLYPPILFVFFNHEFLKQLDKRNGLTAEAYQELTERKNAFRRAIEAAQPGRER